MNLNVKALALAFGMLWAAAMLLTRYARKLAGYPADFAGAVIVFSSPCPHFLDVQVVFRAIP